MCLTDSFVCSIKVIAQADAKQRFAGGTCPPITAHCKELPFKIFGPQCTIFFKQLIEDCRAESAAATGIAACPHSVEHLPPDGMVGSRKWDVEGDDGPGHCPGDRICLDDIGLDHGKRGLNFDGLPTASFHAVRDILRRGKLLGRQDG